MIAERNYKYILAGSYVLYHYPTDNLFHPCLVRTFSHNNPFPQLSCVKLRVIIARWEQIYPIEAYNLLKDKANVYGFKDGEEVTVKTLMEKMLHLQQKNQY